jgi:nucleoside-diphosphate-sugar epimerase
VGAWIANHLLARGEDPKAVRVLDLAPPAQELLDHGIGYTKVNITDELAVETAFEEPWPATAANLPLTVYHTAAVIRPSDRLQSMLSLCSKVNIDGTRNVLSVAKKAGASCFIWTSSGSIGIHRPKFWIMPWATEPKRVVQVLNDEAKLPEKHEEFFGNYAVSKAEAERIVRTADDPENNFRTGCIRPVNGIYGTGSENNMAITDIYLRNGGSPT